MGISGTLPRPPPPMPWRRPMGQARIGNPTCRPTTIGKGNWKDIWITEQITIMITTGDKEYFKGIGKIPYEGKGSDNPLAFKYYDADKRVGDRTMKEHF